MKYLQPLEQILSSWKKCIEAGIPSQISSPPLKLDSNSLQGILNCNDGFTSRFEKAVLSVSELITEEYVFLY